MAEQLAEKVDVGASAPKGASDFERLTVSLKRYPDTKPLRYRQSDALMRSLYGIGKAIL